MKICSINLKDNDMKANSKIKFSILSFIGIFIFFFPFNNQVPIVYMINKTKELLGDNLKYVVITSTVVLFVGMILGKVFKVPLFQKYFKGDGIIKSIFYTLSAVSVALVVADVNVPFIRHPQIGGKILTMASTVFLTIAIAGMFVIFIIKSGIVEFMAILMEPIMRPVFKLPGEAAVNILSSFVSSASIGVYFTEQYFESKTYTKRQACSVVSSFSVISVGYIGVLVSIAGIENMYGTILITSFVLVMIMGAIMVRIPPLLRIPDKNIDGSEQVVVKQRLGVKGRLNLALEKGIQRSNDFTLKAFGANMIQSLKFAQKTVGVMVPTVIIVLTLVYFTPIFTNLGHPLIPIIKLLGIPDAAKIAPSAIIGIVEISLPSILVGGAGVAKQISFFVVLLSIVQIIFFSEAGNAILSSKIPLNALRLVELFVIRTIIAMPLVALATHILV